jgi:hypothetical protein
MCAQYLTKNDTTQIHDFIDKIKKEDLISTASYDEGEMLAKFNLFSEDIQLQLAKCSIHIAVIGAGQKTFGQIKHNGQIMEIEEIFKDNNIKYNLGQNFKYESDMLSSRRLVRLFRYLISEFIKKTNKNSYLWRKYSDQNMDFSYICFPGAEHLVEKETEAIYLMSTYNNMDTLRNTKFLEKLERTYIARGIMTPEVFKQKLKEIKEKEDQI